MGIKRFTTPVSAEADLQCSLREGHITPQLPSHFCDRITCSETEPLTSLSRPWDADVAMICGTGTQGRQGYVACVRVNDTHAAYSLRRLSSNGDCILIST